MENKPEYLQHRLDKLKALKEQSINPYPYRFDKTHGSTEILDNYNRLSEDESIVSFAGRVVSLRGHGKTLFAHLVDNDGKLQIYARKDDMGESFKLFKKLDIGDFLGVEGTVFTTKTGEITIKAKTVTILSKSLRPLPEKWHGLQDKELRYRHRYLDLIANPEVKELFVKRAIITREIRNFLDSRDFLEVETPVLQPIYGGAAARPFVTHHNALDFDLYLRIADELYLRRLLMGGYEKVYEMAKDFRNEGMDKTHNPEFTMLEFYWAYADYNDLMDMLEEMYRYLAQTVVGSLELNFGEHTIDLSKPFARIPYFQGINEACGQDVCDMTESELKKLAEKFDIDTSKMKGRGDYFDAFFEHFVEPKLIQPTFLKDFPIEISPLAKVHRDDPRLAERFELFIAGFEFGNAFSELNDPLDQRARMEQQATLIDRGHEEAHPVDEDFIFALEHGMPPTAGYGIGVDRIVMLMTNSQTIRDIIFFPTMKPEDQDG
ncbi:MAG: lysine--tRNA ligase [candidate division Zixibacteria bacterium]|nr:lysine--tRNA ligase [candidate division Zixibacteria bacterium]